MPRHEIRRRLTTVLVVAGVAVVVFVGAVIGFYVSDTDGEPRTIRGLGLASRDAGNLTRAEFEPVLGAIANEVAGMEVRIDFPDGPRMLSGEELGISLDEEDLVAKAFAAGREGGTFDRFQAWLASFTSGPTVTYRLRYDPARAKAAVGALDGLTISTPVEPDLVMSPERGLVVRPGAPGVRIDQGAVVERLGRQVESGGPFDVDAPTITLPPSVADDDLRALADRLNVLTAEGIDLVMGDEERTVLSLIHI